MAAKVGILCRQVGFEAANAMSVGERYRKPLRDTFLKLQSTYKLKPLTDNVEVITTGRKLEKTKQPRPIDVDDKYILEIAKMTINSTVGPESICPTILV